MFRGLGGAGDLSPDSDEMDQLDLQQLEALVPGGQSTLAGMSAADQAQFAEELMGSMGSALEGMFSGKFTNLVEMSPIFEMLDNQGVGTGVEIYSVRQVYS